MSDVLWLPIKGFEDRYEVSSEGEVRTIARVITWADGSHAKFQPAVVLSQYRPTRRPGVLTYSRVNLNRGGRQNHISGSVHVLVLEAFVGPRPSAHVARHLDGNTENNRLSNLAWGTPLENAQDRDAHGHTARGTRHARAVLTEADVIAIRASEENGPVLALRYGVRKQAIYDVRHGKHWRHVPAPQQVSEVR